MKIVLAKNYTLKKMLVGMLVGTLYKKKSLIMAGYLS